MKAVRSVGLNALYLDPEVSGGTETYLRELVPVLLKSFPAVRFEIATTRRGAHALRADGWDAMLEIHELPTDDTDRGTRLIAEHLLLPALSVRRRWDVVHGMANRASAFLPCASVLTLHDVIFLTNNNLGAVRSLMLKLVTARAFWGAQAIITLTESARRDIEQRFGIDRGMLAVIPHGLGRRGSPTPTSEQVIRKRYGLRAGPVVLCVAAKRPHKNQELLVRALQHLPAGVTIVCAGHEEGYELGLRNLAQDLGVNDRLRLPGYVSDDDLEGLWSIAACAAFPTRAEGFGLPVLEAMRRGVPVACSDIPVLREVGGAAASYFDPDDPRGAAAAIRAACGNLRLAALGRDHASQFTWEAAALATFDIYERAVQSQGKRVALR